jgi:L-threonylcarbamoyladenylate synthase
MTSDNLQKVTDELNEDKLMAISTETVYGLAGNAYSEIALKKIFKLKNEYTN